MNRPDPDFWRGRRVLVTGHTGFKGSWLVLWLLELGAEVVGLALEPEPVSPPGQPLFEALHLAERLGDRHRVGDILDSAAVRAAVEATQPEVVLHLAAQPLVRRSYSDPLGTWSTNVQGTLVLLEALKPLQHQCSAVLITTDKVYENREWEWGYREDDRLGGHDPYSASKAAMELLAASWRSSFCGPAPHQTHHLAIATARAGNVIGGGDWATDRIVPDAMRAWSKDEVLAIRNPQATRPWQHVLEPLTGYLRLAEKLREDPTCFSRPYNFGPKREANRSVAELLVEIGRHWDKACEWEACHDSDNPCESNMLHLEADRAKQDLNWQVRWNFFETCQATTTWYARVFSGEDAVSCCLSDIESYEIAYH